MIDQQPGKRVRLAAIALLAAFVLLGAIGTFSQTNATNPPVNQAVAGDELFPNLPGMVDDYPPIVAYVDGHPIPGKLLAIRVYTLEQSQDPNLDKSHPARDALRNVIRDQILIDHAEDYGISVSYDEARTEAQRQKALILGVAAAQTDTAQRAQQMGVSVDDYFDLPSVIQGYRESMTLGEMQQFILNKESVYRQDGEAKQQAALTAFANGIHAKVQVLITVQ